METILEEWADRDRQIAGLCQDVTEVKTRLESIDKRMNGIENWMRMMVISFVGLAASLVVATL